MIGSLTIPIPLPSSSFNHPLHRYTWKSNLSTIPTITMSTLLHSLDVACERAVDDGPTSAPSPTMSYCHVVPPCSTAVVLHVVLPCSTGSRRASHTIPYYHRYYWLQTGIYVMAAILQVCGVVSHDLRHARTPHTDLVGPGPSPPVYDTYLLSLYSIWHTHIVPI